MRTWLVYGSVVLVSVVAGVTLGGGPGAFLDSSDSSSFVSSADDVPPAAPEVPNFTTPVIVTTVEGSDSAPTSTEPTAPTTTAAANTAKTVAAASTTTEAVSPSTTSADEPTDATATSDPKEAEAQPRGDLSVAVVNGIGTSGLAGRAATALSGMGYVEPATRDTDLADRTLVYFQSGLDAEATRLAVESGLASNATENIDLLTGAVGAGADEFDLILVLGLDRVGLAAV
jgi:hypothetical protein